MPAPFLVQLFIQGLLNQLFGVGMVCGRFGPQGAGYEGNKYYEADGNADGIMQSGSLWKEWEKEDTHASREYIETPLKSRLFRLADNSSAGYLLRFREK